MTEIVFHIGAHKCATTSIQQTLRTVSGNDSSVIYRDGTKLDELQTRIIKIAAGRDPASEIPAVAESILRLSDKAPGIDKIILSNENFLGSMLGLSWEFYPYADRLRKIIDIVSEHMPSKVFLQCRETLPYLKSSYNFRVRHGLRISYEQFLQKCNLSSISWMSLGEQILDNGNFNFMILPIEDLKDPTQESRVKECKSFIYSNKEFVNSPVETRNASRNDLVIFAMQFLGKIGLTVSEKQISQLSRDIQEIEQTIGKSSNQIGVAAGVLQATMEKCGFTLGIPVCRLILHDYYFSTKSHKGIDTMLTNHFAPDYRNFREKYLPRECQRSV